MIDKIRKIEAKKNFDQYLLDGLIEKRKDDLAQTKYLENAELSLKVANELLESSNKPYLWIIVISYYAMFYSANAVLLKLGYKIQDKIAHKVTNEALIVLILDKLKKELLEDYEVIKADAMEIVSIKAENLIEDYELELSKRSRFQYNMLEETKEAKAKTSISRANKFVFEMKKLLK
ncbi:MAG: HEPN domain-containing protein [DPANN group archaeon]|nr:HEPN domain-containing protein [DPANN group archaeon]